jgi:hypothetical protein
MNWIELLGFFLEGLVVRYQHSHFSIHILRCLGYLKTQGMYLIDGDITSKC